ncbi:MAG: AAA family ATPase [Nannocystaceae bacterium]
MRLGSFAVRNYRSFAYRTDVELRPLTLLFGYNSAGKSALLRWLPIVAGSTEPGATSALALDIEAARGASFEDLLSRHSGSDKLGLGLGWIDSAGRRLDVDMQLVSESRSLQQIVEQLTIGSRDGIASHELQAVWTPDLELPIERRRYVVSTDAQEPEEIELPFEGLVPSEAAFDYDSVQRLLVSNLGQRMGALRLDTHWLTAVRAVPQRSKERGPRPRRLGSDGALAGDFLAHDRLDDGSIIATVSAWYERATDHRLDVQLHADSTTRERFVVVLEPRSADRPIRIPLPDTGEGMAQVLPVLVLGALARHGRLGANPLLLIEHPELHLHPAAHADLASYFCELARDVEGSTCVLETHSENLLLRVQLAIARRELDPERVIVHWVRSLPEGSSVVEPITFDDLARPQGNWPPGVFSADVRQARELLRIRRERGSA